MTDIRQIWVAGAKVGLVGLDQIFETVASETFDSDDDLGEKLLELATKTKVSAFFTSLFRVAA